MPSHPVHVYAIVSLSGPVLCRQELLPTEHREFVTGLGRDMEVAECLVFEAAVEDTQAVPDMPNGCRTRLR